MSSYKTTFRNIRHITVLKLGGKVILHKIISSGANINGLFSVQASHKIDQTALFPTEDGTAVVVRLDNPNGETVKVNLAGVFETAVKCEFDGKPVEGSADMHEFELPPYGMISVRLS